MSLYAPICSCGIEAFASIKRLPPLHLYLPDPRILQVANYLGMVIGVALLALHFSALIFISEIRSLEGKKVLMPGHLL